MVPMDPYSQQTEVFFPPKVKRHLRPFYPYLDKYNVTTHSLEQRADEEPHTIQLQTIRTWIKACEQTHDRHCISLNAKAFGKPQWLIDVSRLCVIPAANQRYVALSYVWGGEANCVSLKIETLDILQKDGSLSSAGLANTIADAIHLTARLEQRFLWVDRLCIVQDDIAEKRSQIQSMRAIYSGAYFTIVAAQGKGASEPLWGGYLSEEHSSPICVQGSHLHGKSKRQLFGTTCDRAADTSEPKVLHSEDLDENVKKLTGESFESAFLQNRGIVDEIIGGMSWENDPYSPSGDTPPNYRSTYELQVALERFGPETWQRLISEGIMQQLAVELTQSTWYSRGWTFQEYLFSPRRLVFHANTVNWDCHCASWHENQLHISTQPCFSRDLKNYISRMDTTSWPNMYRLIRLISLFNRRVLTYPEDVLDAFEGPLQTFRATFKFGFIAGLPQAFFDAALLWQPYSPLTPRQFSRAISNPESYLPTWSWVGWQGNLHSESWLASFDYTLGTNGWSGAITPSSTISTVKWSWSMSATGSKNTVIVSANEYRSKYLSDNRSPLPKGWSAVGESREVFLFSCPEDYQPFGYRFDDKYQPFRYPVPTMVEGQQLAPSSRAGFLHGLTCSATFAIEALMVRRPLVRHGCITARLVDRRGRPAGYLRLNEDPDNPETEVGDVCELIQLSAGQMIGGALREHTLDWEGGTSFLDMTAFINVMWVVWEGGIAHRKAVGRVKKDVWQQTRPVKIDITLG
jgi:hypothetical protein